MALGIIGDKLKRKIEALENNRASGRVQTIVTGSSVAYGGIEDPLFVPCSFIVKHAQADLAKEYEMKDASRIYNYGDDVYSGEMKIRVTGNDMGFFVEYFQLDPNESWEIIFNWFARG